MGVVYVPGALQEKLEPMHVDGVSPCMHGTATSTYIARLCDLCACGARFACMFLPIQVAGKSKSRTTQ